MTILSQVSAEGVGDGDELGFGEAFGGELDAGDAFGAVGAHPVSITAAKIPTASAVILIFILSPKVDRLSRSSTILAAEGSQRAGRSARSGQHAKHARPADLPHRRPEESSRMDDPEGAKAPQAAGVIHADFEEGFIMAEVIGFQDLVGTGSIAEARAKGKARIEGKDYVRQDRDVVEFRFNN